MTTTSNSEELEKKLKAILMKFGDAAVESLFEDEAATRQAFKEAVEAIQALIQQATNKASEAAKDFQWTLDRQLDLERVDKMLYSTSNPLNPSLEEQLRKWSIELRKNLKRQAKLRSEGGKGE